MIDHDELKRIADRELACHVPPTSHRLAQGALDLIAEVARLKALIVEWHFARMLVDLDDLTPIAEDSRRESRYIAALDALIGEAAR